MKIKDLQIDQIATIEGIILSITEKKTKNNDSYIVIDFSDGTTTILVRMWNTSLETFGFDKGQVVFLTIKNEEYNNKSSYTAQGIQPSQSNPMKFVMSPPMDLDFMFDQLLNFAGSCGIYSEVTTRILNDYKKDFLTWSAAKSIHHNIYGGLLYHTYRMAVLANQIAKVYDQFTIPMAPEYTGIDINYPLLMSGTILHDIGKLMELDTDQFGAAEYTRNGRLLGHLFSGAELVGQYARSSNLNDEYVELLQHMLASHHGKPEYQAIVQPAIPEAMILHHIDKMDADIYQYEVATSEVQPGEFTDRIFGLGNIPVYRPTWRTSQPPKTPTEHSDDEGVGSDFTDIEDEGYDINFGDGKSGFTLHFIK